MRRRLLVAGAAVVLGVPAGVPPAYADEQVVATPPNRYTDEVVAIDQGEAVTFTNADTVDHDVMARQKGTDDKPLFSSPLVGAGRSAPVDGTQYLTTGDYAFFCSLHPQMTGTLRVGPAGTPAPRPGGGASPGPGGQTAGDTTAPALRLGVRDKRLSDVARRGALRVSVTVDEPATVKLVLRAGRAKLGAATARPAAAGTHRVSVKLTRAGTRRVRRARRLRLSLSATARDGAGNAVTQRKNQTLRRKGR